MIYKIFLNDEILYYPNDNVYSVENAVLNEKLNEAGTLEFDIYPNNPKYSEISVGDTYVSITRDDYEIFYGKVTEITSELSSKKHIYVRGILAEMYDAIANRDESDYLDDLSNFVKKNPFEKNFSVVKNKPNLKLSFDIEYQDGLTFMFVKRSMENGKYYKSETIAVFEHIVIDAPYCWVLAINNTGSEIYGNTSSCYNWEYTDEHTSLTWTEATDISVATFDMYKYVNPYEWKVTSIFKDGQTTLICPSSLNRFGKNTPVGFGAFLNYTGKKDYLTEYKEKYVEKYGLFMKVVKAPTDENPHAQHIYDIEVCTLENYGKHSNQPVEFGRNLISFKKKENYETIVNAVIPWAKNPEDSESELSIYGCNEDIFHIYSKDKFIENWDSIKKYGRIEVSQEFNDALDEYDLLAKAESWLAERSYPTVEIQATAFDLSVLDRKFNPFEIGDTVTIKKDNLGLEEDLDVSIVAKTTYINDLTKNVITLGTYIKSYTRQIANAFSIKYV